MNKQPTESSLFHQNSSNHRIKFVRPNSIRSVVNSWVKDEDPWQEAVAVPNADRTVVLREIFNANKDRLQITDNDKIRILNDPKQFSKLQNSLRAQHCVTNSTIQLTYNQLLRERLDELNEIRHHAREEKEEKVKEDEGKEEEAGEVLKKKITVNKAIGGNKGSRITRDRSLRSVCVGNTRELRGNNNKVGSVRPTVWEFLELEMAAMTGSSTKTTTVSPPTTTNTECRAA